MSPFTPTSHPTIAHRYTRRLLALELTSTPPISPSHNTILWLGGLGDGLLTVSYPTTLSTSLPPTWTLVSVLLTSSYSGWGTSSLSRDAAELARCVAYFRTLRPDGKILLMGHSTGCQDIVTYVTAEPRKEYPGVDGAVLQAPASDRYALEMVVEKDVREKSVAMARRWVEEGRGGDVLPKSATGDVLRAPVSAERWLSLLSPEGTGADDLFSEDLGDAQLERTFGRWPRETPVCVLFSGRDEFVPESVDKVGLVERWRGFVERAGGRWDAENGGVVEGLYHNADANDEREVESLLGRVRGFVRRVEKGDWEDESGKESHL